MIAYRTGWTRSSHVRQTTHHAGGGRRTRHPRGGRASFRRAFRSSRCSCQPGTRRRSPTNGRSHPSCTRRMPHARSPTWCATRAGARARPRIGRFQDVRAEKRRRSSQMRSGRGGEWLDAREVARLFECHGIPVAEWADAVDPVAGARCGRRPRGRGRAQGASGRRPSTRRRSVRSARVWRRRRCSWAAVELAEACSSAGVEPRIPRTGDGPGGVELLVGVVQDPLFGAVVACGAGGDQAEVLKDVAARVGPLTRLSTLGRCSDPSPPFRCSTAPGRARGGRRRLEDVLGVSAMVEAHQEIAELDLNPIVATPDGAVAVDFRVRVKSAPPRRPWPATWK